MDASVGIRRRMLEERPDAILERAFELETGAREQTLQRIGVEPFDETRGIVGGFAAGFRGDGVERRARTGNGVALDEEHRWLDLGA